MGKILNITPHPITLVDTANQQALNLRQHREIRPIRVRQESEIEYLIEYMGATIPVKVILASSSQEKLPPVEPGTLYIVSRLVADTFKGQRKDFVFPYDFQRTESGGITGCYSLARFGT